MFSKALLSANANLPKEAKRSSTPHFLSSPPWNGISRISRDNHMDGPNSTETHMVFGSCRSGMLPSQPPQASKHLDRELVEQVASGIKDKRVGHVEPLDIVVHDSLFHHDGPLCQELWTTHS